MVHSGSGCLVYFRILKSLVRCTSLAREVAVGQFAFTPHGTFAWSNSSIARHQPALPLLFRGNRGMYHLPGGALAVSSIRGSVALNLFDNVPWVFLLLYMSL